MRETSDLIEKCGDGASPSEAHCGGWEGLGEDGGGTGAGTYNRLIINCHRNRVHYGVDFFVPSFYVSRQNEGSSCGI